LAHGWAVSPHQGPLQLFVKCLEPRPANSRSRRIVSQTQSAKIKHGRTAGPPHNWCPPKKRRHARTRAPRSTQEGQKQTRARLPPASTFIRTHAISFADVYFLTDSSLVPGVLRPAFTQDERSLAAAEALTLAVISNHPKPTKDTSSVKKLCSNSLCLGTRQIYRHHHT